MLDLLLWEGSRRFGGDGPVQPTDQILTVPFTGQPAGPLLLCLMVEGSFNGRPVVLQIDVGFCHEGRFMPVPLVDGIRRPTPFLEVCQGGSHWSLDVVPGVLLLVDLVTDAQPCLFDVLDVVWGPVVDQGVQSPDVVDDDLVSWVSELFVGHR